MFHANAAGDESPTVGIIVKNSILEFEDGAVMLAK